MPISTISQTISTIPEAGHRGVDVQTTFVTKQEDFQDHLQGTTVSELNALKTQINTMAGEMNTTASQVNTNANTASTKASEASASATSASTSASTATTKASQASASATSASTSATSASTSATSASTSATSASTSASTATTKASEASAKASEASASASTATTQAGIATTKASEASASATSASTSRNQAETFAQQAQASATSIDVNNLVHRTGDESIAGVKTFSSTIVGSINGNSATVTRGVYTIGNQTIDGIKTFSSSPIVPTPTSGTQAVNKDYADLKVALASFVGTNQSLASNGYQKLPGGLIIQWGITTEVGSRTEYKTFPVAFPTAALVILATVQGTTVEQSNWDSSWAVLISKSQFQIGCGNDHVNHGINLFWFAIGY